MLVGSNVGYLHTKVEASAAFRMCHLAQNVLAPSLLPHYRLGFENGEPASFLHVCQQRDRFRIQSAGGGGKGLGKGDIGVFVADNEAVLNRNMPILPAVNCPGTEWLINRPNGWSVEFISGTSSQRQL